MYQGVYYFCCLVLLEASYSGKHKGSSMKKQSTCRGAQNTSKQSKSSRSKQVPAEVSKPTKVVERIKNIKEQLRILLGNVNGRKDSEAGPSLEEASDTLDTIEAITRKISAAVAERSEEGDKKANCATGVTSVEVTGQSSNTTEK